MPGSTLTVRDVSAFMTALLSFSVRRAIDGSSIPRPLSNTLPTLWNPVHASSDVLVEKFTGIGIPLVVNTTFAPSLGASATISVRATSFCASCSPACVMPRAWLRTPRSGKSTQISQKWFVLEVFWLYAFDSLSSDMSCFSAARQVRRYTSHGHGLPTAGPSRPSAARP